LASRILLEVAAPRNGVKQNFVTGRNDIIAQQIFWAVICSHDIMARFKDKSFKNDPSVSAEYVKFRIMNTGMDLVDQLVKRVRVLEEKVTSMQKDLKSADTKAQTASNNVSNALKAIESLNKKVTSLEGRNRMGLV
jgi:peptidoglycan hydrolase CwlO-like protein